MLRLVGIKLLRLATGVKVLRLDDELIMILL